MNGIKKNNIFAIIVTCLAVMLSTTGAQAQEISNRIHGTVAEQIDNSNLQKMQQDNALVQDLLNYAHTFRGVPYRHGAMSPRGFDCSGFTSYVFSKYGYKLNRTSGGQINDGKRVSRNELKPGDLVFFTGRAVGRRIGHVGIVTQVNSDNTFKFIHAACRSGITVSHSSESYYSRRYMGACRVVQ